MRFCLIPVIFCFPPSLTCEAHYAWAFDSVEDWYLLYDVRKNSRGLKGNLQMLINER